MKTTLGKLWLGELTPWSEAEEEYEDVLRYAEILEACFETLMEQLDEEGKMLLKKYEQTQNDYLFLAREDSFKKGFSLGVKLMAEAFFMK